MAVEDVPTVPQDSPAAAPEAPVTTDVTDVPAAAPVETPAAVPDSSLLGDDPSGQPAPTPSETPAADTPSQEAPSADQPVEQASQSAEPAPLPDYEPWTLPDGYTQDEAKLGEFTKELAELERDTGLPHDKAKEFGQKLIDRHVAEVQNTIERLTERYTNTWEKQKNDWKAAFESDPELGGNRSDTTLTAARNVIKSYAGNAEQVQEFRELMTHTGLGNHPAVIRLLANVGKKMFEEGSPVPASAPAKAPTSKLAKRYGGAS